MTEDARDLEGEPADDDRAQREREFSRRQLLRAGGAIPIALSLGGLAAACGGGGHGDSAPNKSSTTSTTSTTTATTTTTTTTTAPPTHADSPHVDVQHVDQTTNPSTVHDDSGPHTDSLTVHNDFYNGPTHGDTITHSDSGPHTDSTVEVPGNHQDTRHGDTPHADFA